MSDEIRYLQKRVRGADTHKCASAVQLMDLKRDLAELKSGCTQHKKELDRFLDENEEHLQDPYARLMLPFLGEATTELSRLSDQVQLTERTYTDALRYFGEGPDPKRRGFPVAQPMRTEDFFGIFKEFFAAYKKVKVDNVRIGEQRAMEAKRRAVSDIRVCGGLSYVAPMLIICVPSLIYQAAEEREKERAEAQARKEAGVDDSAVLENLLGTLRSGGHTPKQKRKARERGEARRSAAKAGGAAGERPSSPSPIDGNPSDVAKDMLAKLQGGAGGEGGLTLPAPSASSRPTRRRDRRTTGADSVASGGRNSVASLQPRLSTQIAESADAPEAAPADADADADGEADTEAAEAQAEADEAAITADEWFDPDRTAMPGNDADEEEDEDPERPETPESPTPGSRSASRHESTSSLLA